MAVPAPWRNHLFFVHVPKTAGTSLREALAARWGDDACWLDYGAEAPETTELIHRWAYRAPDLFRLQEMLEDTEERRFLFGHVLASKYMSLVGAGATIAFLREPVSQLMSHYAHVCRRQGYAHDLATFTNSRQGAGLQSHMLADIPLPVWGVVGITERYSESLRVLNATYGVGVAHRLSNLNPDKPLGAAYVTPEGLSLQKLPGLQRDARLYAQANALLDQRLAALDQGVAFVNGAVQRTTSDVVEGYAFVWGSAFAVQVRVQAGSDVLAEGLAVENAPHLRAWNVPRNAFVRFALRLRRPLTQGEPAQVQVSDTGQVLGEWVAS